MRWCSIKMCIFIINKQTNTLIFIAKLLNLIYDSI